VSTLDLYCERTGPGLVNEPLNAITNLAFFVAIWAVWRLTRAGPHRDVSSSVLLALMLAIAVGSTLFHTFATAWAHWLDVLPILLFQLAFLWCYLRQVGRLGLWRTLLVLVAFLAASLYGRSLPQVLNGSLMYAPSLALILALGLYHYATRRARRADLLAAGGLLALSIAFRTMDAAVCPAVPAGTHFLWHVLNAGVLFLCMRALLAHRTAAARVAV
jgi:hypothetical protein